MIFRSLLRVCLFLLTAGAVIGEELSCTTCVEDVVLETREGDWLSGYIYWRRPPFRYLDLMEPSNRLELERARGGVEQLEIWEHAVAISRDRLPDRFGAVPAEASLTPLDSRPIGQVALLVGEPVSLPIESLRRIYPRIGSGLPAIQTTEGQLRRLVENELPFVNPKRGECLGCPMGAEDVTLVLDSGELVSGLMSWHGATVGLEGYDLRAGRRPRGGWYGGAFGGPEEEGEILLWQAAVSGPRRTFESDGSIDYRGQLVADRGFLRVGPSVLLVAPASVYPLPSVAFILPGPSRAASPLLIPREQALRLLLQQPRVAMSSHRDRFGVYCFSYKPATLKQLAGVCDAWALEAFQYDAPGILPDNLVVSTPGSRREPPTLAEEIDLITLFFDGGT